MKRRKGFLGGACIVDSQGSILRAGVRNTDGPFTYIDGAVEWLVLEKFQNVRL